jgi:hypothetical protein
MRPDELDDPVRTADLVVLGGHPRRHGGIEDVRRERREGEHADHRREAGEVLVRPRPEDGRDEQRDEEVRQVDEPDGVVPPSDVGRPVPQLILEPHRRDRLPEQGRLDLDLRKLARVHEPAVGVAAQPVVREQDGHERQPVEDEPWNLAAKVRRGERAHADTEPREHEVVRGRNADGGDHHGGQHAPDDWRPDPDHAGTLE